MSSKDIAEVLGISKVAVLNYLKLLKEKNKIKEIRKGRRIIYELA